MADLTLEDLQAQTPEVIESELLGKRVFFRVLSFGDQLELNKLEVADEDAAVLHIIALALCNQDGSPFFPDVSASKPESFDTAIEVLARLPARAIMSLFEVAQKHSGTDLEEEVKN
jgi:hypothetical protein